MVNYGITQNSLLEGELPALKNSSKQQISLQKPENKKELNSTIVRLTPRPEALESSSSTRETVKDELTDIKTNLDWLKDLTNKALNDVDSYAELNKLQEGINHRLKEIEGMTDRLKIHANALKNNAESKSDLELADKLAPINSVTMGLKGFNVNGDRLATADDLIKNMGATGFDRYKIKDVDDLYLLDIKTGKVTISGNPNTIVHVDSLTHELTLSPTHNLNKLVFTSGVASAKDDVFAVELAKQAITAKSVLASGGSITVSGLSISSANVDDNGNGDYSTTIDGTNVKFTIANSSSPEGKDATITASTNIYINSNRVFTIDSPKTSNREATGLDLERLGTRMDKILTVNVSGASSGTYLVSRAGVVTNPTSVNPDEKLHISFQKNGEPSLKGESEVAASNSGVSISPIEILDNALKKVNEGLALSNTSGKVVAAKLARTYG